MISKRLARLRMIWPVMRLGLRYLDDRDLWNSVDHHVPVFQYGPGCVREFQWYLEGESRVNIRSIDDLCSWLRRCRYVPDDELFNEQDYWQHPATFEQIRKGDCEDHALWAWRKLRELGKPCEFMIGRHESARHSAGEFHAWVVFRDREEDYLLETTERRRSKMLRRLSAAKADYIPHLSVTSDLTRKIYSGMFEWLDSLRTARRLLRERC